MAVYGIEETTVPRWSRGDGEPDPEMLDRAIEAIRKHCRPIRVMVFGSGARGELTAESDLDLLVVTTGPLTAEQHRQRRFEITEEIGYDPRADVLVSTEAEIAAARKSLAGVLRTAVEEGVTVYEAGERRPYRKRPRPAGLDERIDPAEAANEARRLAVDGRDGA